MHAGAGRADLAVRREAIDDGPSPWLEFPACRIATAVQVDPHVGIVGGEHVTHAVELPRRVGVAHVVERTPCRAVGRRGVLPVGSTRHLRRFLLPGLVHQAPQDPLGPYAECLRDVVEARRDDTHCGSSSPRARSIRSAQGLHHVFPSPNAAPPGGPIHLAQRLQRGSQVTGWRASYVRSPPVSRFIIDPPVKAGHGERGRGHEVLP